MKHTLITLAACLGLAGSALSAETTVVLGGVHNCCNACQKGIEKAGEKLRDTTITAKGGTVTIVAKSKSEAKKAIEALNDAGYHGKVEGGEFASKSPAASSASEKKVKSASVTVGHNCCDKCRATLKDAVKSAPGVTDTDISAKALTFKVTGEFAKADVLSAINNAGFHASVK